MNLPTDNLKWVLDLDWMVEHHTESGMAGLLDWMRSEPLMGDGTPRLDGQEEARWGWSPRFVITLVDTAVHAC